MNCINIKIATSFKDKLLGLMFKRNFNYSLLLKNTNGIHTFFMKENIDVVLLDKDYNIIKIYENISPFKIILPKKNVKHTLELPLNNLSNLNNIISLLQENTHNY